MKDRKQGRENEVHKDTVGGNTATYVCVCVHGNNITAPLASRELHFQQMSASVLGQSPGKHTCTHNEQRQHTKVICYGL